LGFVSPGCCLQAAKAMAPLHLYPWHVARCAMGRAVCKLAVGVWGRSPQRQSVQWSARDGAQGGELKLINPKDLSND
jgi:hypothetical protein